MYRKSIQAKMEQQNDENSYQFLKRISHLPAMETAVSQLASIYSNTKARNRVFNYTFNATEYGVHAVFTTTKPIVNRFEKPIEILDNFACNQLDKLEVSYPIIKKPAEEIYGETKCIVEKKVQPTFERVTYVKDYGTEKVNNIKNYGVDKANGVKNTMSSVKNYGMNQIYNTLETPYGKYVVNQINGLLDSTEKCVDYYLPNDQEEDKSASRENEKDTNNAINRTLKLSGRIRRRMFNKAMRDLDNIQKRSKQTIDNMNFTVDLMQYAQNHMDGVTSGLVSAKGKLDYIWEEINKSEEEVAQDHDISAKSESTDNPQLNTSHLPMSDIDRLTFERRLIATARHLSMRMKRTVSTTTDIVSSVSGHLLPPLFVTYLNQARSLSENVLNSFTQAKTLQDVPAVALDQVRESLNRIGAFVSLASVYVSKVGISDWLLPDFELDLGDFDFSGDHAFHGIFSLQNGHAIPCKPDNNVSDGLNQADM